MQAGPADKALKKGARPASADELSWREGTAKKDAPDTPSVGEEPVAVEVQSSEGDEDWEPDWNSQADSDEEGPTTFEVSSFPNFQIFAGVSHAGHDRPL